jgi:hypothetical protein
MGDLWRIDAGMVVRGKIADLILLEANPLNDPGNAFWQAGVMLPDRWFTEDASQDRLRSLALVNDALPP